MKRILIILAACVLSLSAMGQNSLESIDDARVFRVGADASADFFLPNSNPSVGLGVRARFGRPDQWFNLIGALRYIYGPRLSGFQIPLMLNMNLLRFDKLSAYVGAGYEFDFIGTYWGCTKFQTGILVGPHTDFRVFFKPYQGDLGVGFTYYF